MVRNKTLSQKLGVYFNDKTTLNRQVLALKKSMDEVSGKLKGEEKKKK